MINRENKNGGCIICGDTGYYRPIPSDPIDTLEYIRLIRLKTAGELLREGEYRINEVCFIVGFNNPSYFARCFQKQFGAVVEPDR